MAHFPIERMQALTRALFGDPLDKRTTSLGFPNRGQRLGVLPGAGLIDRMLGGAGERARRTAANLVADDIALGRYPEWIDDTGKRVAEAREYVEGDPTEDLHQFEGTDDEWLRESALADDDPETAYARRISLLATRTVADGESYRDGFFLEDE